MCVFSSLRNFPTSILSQPSIKTQTRPKHVAFRRLLQRKILAQRCPPRYWGAENWPQRLMGFGHPEMVFFFFNSPKGLTRNGVNFCWSSQQNIWKHTKSIQMPNLLLSNQLQNLICWAILEKKTYGKKWDLKKKKKNTPKNWASFFQVSFWSPNWRSLNPWKGHLKHPKRSLGRTWGKDLFGWEGIPRSLNDSYSTMLRWATDQKTQRLA